MWDPLDVLNHWPGMSKGKTRKAAVHLYSLLDVPSSFQMLCGTRVAWHLYSSCTLYCKYTGWLGAQGISYEEALGKFWVLDAEGLITIKRPTALNDTVKSFARKTQEDVEGESLAETVRRVRTS